MPTSPSYDCFVGSGLCSICKKQKKTGGVNAELGVFVCNSCHHQHLAPKRACTTCGRKRPVHKYVDAAPFCNTCYKRDILLAVCGFCRKKRRLHARDPEHQRPMCLTCWDERFAPREPCYICGTISVAEMRGPNRECICHHCWRNDDARKEECIRCGNRHIVYKRTPLGNAVCPPCALAEQAPGKCTYCRKIQPLIHIDGEWVCRPCYRSYLQPKHACADCDEVALVHLWRDAHTPVCQRCYAKQDRIEERCATCGKESRVVARNEDGTAMCPNCYARKRRLDAHISE